MDNKFAFSDSDIEIQGTIGSGGGGSVYKAWHKGLKKFVAIKELKGGTQNSIETQRNEVEALKNVKNKHLPQVLNFISQGDKTYTVLEFVEGNDFESLLKQGVKFTVPQVVKWYGQLASALESIHKNGICHRDIKPANIMLTSDGDVCLIDFNAAVVSGNYVQLISRSLGYASPEQYEIFEEFREQLDLLEAMEKAAPDPEKTELLTSGSSSGNDPEKTELLTSGSSSGNDPEKTELLTSSSGADNDPEKTELLTSSSSSNGSGNTGLSAGSREIQKSMLSKEIIWEQIAKKFDKIDWVRSDIFSLGATMYHILTGIHPPQRAEEVTSIEKLGKYGEGLAFIIDKSMSLEPNNRFASAQALSFALNNIRKYDRRWKAAVTKMITAAVCLPVSFGIFASIALAGVQKIRQEKSENFFAAVRDIEKSSRPLRDFEDALSDFGNRIELYSAAAKNLWQNGNYDECRSFIYDNLTVMEGIAESTNEKYELGNINYIMADCIYCGSYGEDCTGALDYYKKAVEYVKDNPEFYRDYAICLAKLNKTAEAQRNLEKAQVLNLPEDSLNLLKAELALAGNDYEKALEQYLYVIGMTGNDYIRYRAYHGADDIYRIRNMPAESVKLLDNCFDKIPLGSVNEMTERLADAYTKCGQFSDAASVYESLIKKGTAKADHYLNLAVIYENQKDYVNAGKILSDARELFPKNYKVFMYSAILEIDVHREKHDDDYSKAADYFKTARSLYRGAGDPEMSALEQTLSELGVRI